MRSVNFHHQEIEILLLKFAQTLFTVSAIVLETQCLSDGGFKCRLSNLLSELFSFSRLTELESIIGSDLFLFVSIERSTN